MKINVFALLFINIVLINTVLSQNNTDRPDPTKINPLDEKAGDFLDINMPYYRVSAESAYENKNYKKAAQYYLYILGHTYDDAGVIYQLSRCYAYIREYELASRYLVRAVNAGFSNFSIIEKDEAFNNIRKTAVFNKALSDIKKYAKQFGEIHYFQGPKMNKCRVRVPESYDPEKKYTLIVGLHGNGGSSEGFIRVADNIKEDNIIFAAPQGPYLKAISNSRMNDRYSWGIEINDKKLWERGDHLSIDYIVSAVEYVSSLYKIDKVYLLGFSEGAAYTYITGIKNPNMFEGIICIGGRLPSTDKSYSLYSEEDIKTSNKLKVFIAHGLLDKAVKIEHGKKAKKKLKKADYDVTMYTYNDGHTIPKTVIDEVIKWINGIK